MKPTELNEYLEAMDRIKAIERLELMDAVQYPHIDDKSRHKSHRNVMKLAYPENFKSKILKTTDLELI